VVKLKRCKVNSDLAAAKNGDLESFPSLVKKERVVPLNKKFEQAGERTWGAILEGKSQVRKGSVKCKLSAGRYWCSRQRIEKKGEEALLPLVERVERKG